MSARSRSLGLDGGYVLRVLHAEGEWTAQLEDVRRGPLVFVAELTFTGVTAVELRYEPPRDRLTGADAPVRGRVRRGTVADGVATLALHEQTGPGDADDLTVTIRHAGVRRRLSPSLGRTARGMLGLPPRRS